MVLAEMTYRRADEATSLLVTLAAIGLHADAAVLRALAAGALRFNDLAEALPSLDDVMLGASLREVGAEGLVTRRVDPGPPLRVLYELTPPGQQLAPLLIALKRWTDDRLSYDRHDARPG